MSKSPELRHARLFRNGSNQALRIPRGFELPGKDVILYREGDRLIVEAVLKNKDRLLDFLAHLQPVSDEFPEVADPVIQSEDIF